MVGSPPQMETMGEPQSSTACKHCSTVSWSVMLSLYSRMRPQPVHVRLQVCSGSSIITRGNFSTRRSLLPAIYLLNLVVMLSGNFIDSSHFHSTVRTLPARIAGPQVRARRPTYSGTVPARKGGKRSDRGGS